MHLSENEGIEGNTFVVTGGLGFVGSALCLELVRRGARQVRAIDFRSTSPWSADLKNKGVRCIQGDITVKKDVERALRGADCVFHLASYGMSGKEMIQLGRVDEVNINGTCHILDACIEFGIKRLIYASTYNVVFGGKEILNGNESLPYFPLDDHVDSYSRSKSIAEQLVLKNNGRPFKDKSGQFFYTCAVRPAAIYGPGEDRHLPRLISLAKLGLLSFKIGEADVKGDWIYIDNLVLALILASMGLLDDIPGRDRRPIAAGQSYFVNDGLSNNFNNLQLVSQILTLVKKRNCKLERRISLLISRCYKVRTHVELFTGSPVNTFEFLQPLLRSLGYNLPKASLPVPSALFLSRIICMIYTMLFPWLNRWWLPQPLMLPAEVYKVGVSHYFSYLKAKEELGYVPMVSPREGMAATISYWQERKRSSLEGPSLKTWLFCTIGMFVLFCAAYLPDIGPVSLFRAMSLFLFRSLTMTRAVFLLATAAHVGEAAYAWHLAKRVDPANACAWFWQTFALGIFSLRFLLKRAQT